MWMCVCVCVRERERGLVCVLVREFVTFEQDRMINGPNFGGLDTWLLKERRDRETETVRQRKKDRHSKRQTE